MLSKESSTTFIIDRYCDCRGRTIMNNFVTEHQVVMRDGVTLYTVLQQPEAEGKFPVVFIRSPYSVGQNDFERLKTEDTHGYATVYQHCRGTGNSRGEFNAYLNERNDGLDTLEWIRKQSFYNGEIFLLGGSYLSTVHFSYLETPKI